MSSDEVLFIGDNSVWSRLAVSYLKDCNFNVTSVFWDYGTDDSQARAIVQQWEGDWILSFKSDFILDSDVITKAKKGSINFHPAPVRYRGIGGYQYAIDNKDTHFGVTCHYIDSQIDHGKIIKVIEFGIISGETPESLMSRTAVYALSLFHEISARIRNAQEIPHVNTQWLSKLYTRAQLSTYLSCRKKQSTV
ncbi:formyltransferase family protein [Xenorhabdus anantnagensis]|uniref:Formyltransferase family protein n=1 Tax=Xenorhabdus anantnagensis TaxID=3025875 RepID=A0ABT5LRL8_9GAMM|nr:formyltransferase family protein [Xenorhabdus anantnagensis]